MTVIITSLLGVFLFVHHVGIEESIKCVHHKSFNVPVTGGFYFHPSYPCSLLPPISALEKLKCRPKKVFPVDFKITDSLKDTDINECLWLQNAPEIILTFKHP